MDKIQKNNSFFFFRMLSFIKETFFWDTLYCSGQHLGTLGFDFGMFTLVTSWDGAKLPPLFGVSGVAPKIKIFCRQCIFDFDHHGPGSLSGLRQLFPSDPRLEENS